MLYEISEHSTYGECKITNNKIIFESNISGEIFFEMEIQFQDWEENAFIFMPACAYNGNRFKKVNRAYPPRFLPEEYSLEPEKIINKLPSLNPDGSGAIEVTSGDMAVPCVGIFYREQKEAMFLFTQQQVKNKNIGFCVSQGKIVVSFPAHRSIAYRFDQPDDENPDSGISVIKGEEITSNFSVETIECKDMSEFYKAFFERRKNLIKSESVENLYTQELWNVMTEVKIKSWDERDCRAGASWGCGGWAGGTGMEHVAMLLKGDEKTKKSTVRVLDFELSEEHQTPAGFFYSTVKDGVRNGSRHLVRESAGALYFILKIFDIFEPKKRWVECARKCADAFVKLYRTYGKFGCWINSETGEMLVGCGFTGVGAISALCRCAQYFDNKEYYDVALESGEYYYNYFEKIGMTYAGPSDILCAPDSESAFLLLEAFVNLYEMTKDKKWLDRAEVCLHYCSSWVVSYTYNFPEDSEFYRLKINTVGSVFASVQNKHAAPGICVLSGDCIYKVYKYTGNKKYLEFVKDIAYFIPQCISTNERPIYAKITTPAMDLPVGVSLPHASINERVNMSDWEYDIGVGNVFCVRNWCENAFFLSYAELMDLEEFKC